MKRIFEYFNSLGEKYVITCDTKLKTVSAVIFISKNSGPKPVDVDSVFNPHMSHKETKASDEFLKACRKRSEQALRLHLHNELHIPFYYKGFSEVAGN
ncbi:hypothetical protein [Serratia sp. P2ACOL2]|uniref:hypothetical protein n=1 Tax=Serratia sp. P2ACOL2 TaxID=2482769 RepID=UPI000EFC5074|nr:hypothetical protein [Serratia sp. P2ACOL2]AYO38496.1 hypothetical protein EBA31_14850 [Serratia sp. P2ACOL2]